LNSSMPPSGKEKLTSAPASAVTVGFVSLGCSKNLVDSQHMAGVLLSEDVALARCAEEADIVLVNTCAFIEEARQESIETIRSVCRLKTEGVCKAVLVTGCMPQRYKKDLRKLLPEVDAFLGLDELDQVGEVARRLAGGEKGILRVSNRSSALFEPRYPALSFTGGPYAYLKIAEGCNHPCSFCAIPSIRGRHRSRPLKSIVAEAESLLAEGFKELNIISQDVTSYGRDLGDGTSLTRLIRNLGAIGGAFWIRLLYGYPSRVSDELLEAMGVTEQVCRYLDVPIQHSHPDILKAMARAGTARAVRSLPARARKIMPDVTLRTTCLVGFPGERESHFEHLLEYLRETQFDHVGVFAYSPEENTRAYGMPGRPAKAVADGRRRRLMLAQKEIVDRKNAALAGLETEVLLEYPAAGKRGAWIGRSRRHAPRVDGCVFVGGVGRDAAPGTFVRARYTQPCDYDMKARCISR